MRRSIALTVATTWLVLLTMAAGGNAVAAPQETPTADEALALQSEGEWEAAAEAWGAIAEQDPESGTAWFHLGYCLHAAGRLDEAIEVHQRAAGFDDYRGIALYNLGCAYALSNRPEEALEALAGAQATGFALRNSAPGDSDLESLRGDPRFQQLLASEQSGWQSLLQQAAIGAQQFWQEHGPEIERQAQIYLQQFMQELGPVLVQLQQKLAQDPRFAQVAQAIQQWMGQRQAAAAHQAPPPLATAEPPAVPESGEQVTLDGAWQRLQAGRLEESLAAFEVLARQNPDRPEAWFGRAYCLHMMGDYERAIEAHKKAATFDEVKGVSLYNLACACALTGRTDAALEALNAAREAGFDVAESAQSDSDLDSVRDDPRFEAIIE